MKMCEGYAFGFEMFEPTSSALNIGCNTTCVDSTFVVQLFAGSTSLGSFTLTPQNDTVQFFGFWNSVAFDKITITETVGSNDNEYFGNFYSGGRPSSSVPEPVSFTLLATGLVGLARKRRRQEVTRPIRTAPVRPSGNDRR